MFDEFTVTHVAVFPESTYLETLKDVIPVASLYFVSQDLSTFKLSTVQRNEPVLHL